MLVGTVQTISGAAYCVWAVTQPCFFKGPPEVLGHTERESDTGEGPRKGPPVKVAQPPAERSHSKEVRDFVCQEPGTSPLQEFEAPVGSTALGQHPTAEGKCAACPTPHPPSPGTDLIEHSNKGQ